MINNNNMDFSDLITQRFSDSIATKKSALKICHSEILSAGKLLIETLRHGNKVLICGNGGSAADAQHFAAELIMRYETDRKSLAAIALTTDSSALTAIANDKNFDEVFSRQIAGLGRSEDLLIVISTSGNSDNIKNAIKMAHKKSLNILLLSGHEGGMASKILQKGDISVIVPNEITGRIQETHILIIHIFCEMVDQFWTNG